MAPRYFPADRDGLDRKAPLQNPEFTGDAKASTPAAGDNDNSVATTEFVANAIQEAVNALPEPLTTEDVQQQIDETINQLPEPNLGLKKSCLVATNVAINLTGEQIIQGVQTNHSRVLVKDQADATKNGLWDTNAGPWTRCADANENSELMPGMLVYIEDGLDKGQIYACTNKGTITIGTTGLTFEKVIPQQFSSTGKPIATALYAALPSDHNRRLEFTFATEKTLLLDSTKLADAPVDTTIKLLNIGEGKLLITPEAGVTLMSFGNRSELRQYEEASLVKRALPNSWVLTGFYAGDGTSIDPGDLPDPTQPWPGDVVDTDAPSKPTGLNVTSVVEQLDNGQQQVRMMATCNSNPVEEEVVAYIFHVKEFGGNFVGFPTNTTYWEHLVKPGTTYVITVAAQDKAGNVGPESDPFVHTAARDTIPPGKPHDAQIFPGLDAFWLEWVNPNDSDLAYIEIYENDVDDPDTATLIGKEIGEKVARTGLTIATTRFYWFQAVDTSGNVSGFSEGVSGTTGTIPEDDKFTFVGVLFKQNDGATNRLTWTAGSISYGQSGETPTTKAISAGFVNWTSGIVYVYYVRGNTALSTTTNLVTVYASGGVMMGVYKGGKDFTLVEGKGYQDGGLVLERTIGANQLVVDQAVITGSAQIADLVVKDQHVQSLNAGKIEADGALFGSVTVDNRALGAIGSTDVTFDDMSRDWVYNTGAPHPNYGTDATLTRTGSRSLASLTGSTVYLSPDRIPFDPNKLYRITFHVGRKSGPSVGSFFLGLVGFKADRVTPVRPDGLNDFGTFYYVVYNISQGLDPGRQEFVAYVKGTAVSNGNGPTSIAQPAKLHPDVRCMAPMALFNLGLATGTGPIMYLDDVKIEVIAEEDVAALVNAGTTKIGPGLVEIDGPSGYTLNNWIYGPDKTKIWGGAVAANTLAANSGVFGQRGIAYDGITFKHNDPSLNKVSWTAGNITYTDDTNTTVTKAIAAGGATWSAGTTMYIFYIQGRTVLNFTTDPVIANDPNSVILATYKGDTLLFSTYGRTIIDGSGITGIMAAFDTAAINTMRANILIAKSITNEMFNGKVVNASNINVNKSNNAINIDPYFQDEPSWEAIGSPPVATGWLVRQTVLTHSAGLYLDSASGKKTTMWDDLRWPVDASKDYTIDIIVYQALATSIFYGVWKFYDYQGNVITTVGAGWPATFPAGGYHYHPSAAPGAQGYKQYLLDIGAHATAKIPTGACYCSFGCLADYNNVGSRTSITRLQMLEHTDGTLVVKGSLKADRADVNDFRANILTANSIETYMFHGKVVTADNLNVTGGLSAISSDIGTMTAGKLQNAAGTMIIDLTNGFISLKVP